MKRILALLIVLTLAFCAPMQAFAVEDLWPITLTDHAGRQVTIEKEPQTIASGYYIATSMLIGLGQTEKMVGVENKAEIRNIYHLSAPELLNLPGLGTVKAFDLEACAALNPDLVVLPLKLKDSAAALEELGFDVIVVNPESQALLEESIAMLGAATGSSDRAQHMLSFIAECTTALAKAIDGADKPTVYLGGNSSFLNTAGPSMYQHSLIENAGAVNVAAEITDTYWVEISYEQLLAWKPEYIVMAADADYPADSVLGNPLLSELITVGSEQVLQIPGFIESWDSPVPGSFLGSLFLASKLHPDLYSHEDYTAAVTGFYETFYGFTPEI